MQVAAANGLMRCSNGLRRFIQGRNYNTESLRGKVCVVTGASAGIGAAIAGDLVQAGMRVVGIARRVNLVQELSQNLEQSSGNPSKGKLYALKADVSNIEEVKEAFKWVQKEMGAINILINNAGFYNKVCLKDADDDELLNVLNTNLVGLAVSCREGLKNMIQHNVTDGQIINVNSMAGLLIPTAHRRPMGLYCASKHGVSALSRGLRGELKPLKGFHIRVTNFCPGGTVTEMLMKNVEKEIPKEKIPYKLMSPRDVSNAIKFVISAPHTVEITELAVQPVGEIL